MVLSQWSGTKKLKMHKVLTIGYSVLLFINVEARGPHKCVLCPRVLFNDQCDSMPRTCTVRPSKKEFCYTRLIIMNRALKRLEKGCTSSCQHIREHEDILMLTWCCHGRKLCNHDHIWLGK